MSAGHQVAIIIAGVSFAEHVIVGDAAHNTQLTQLLGVSAQ